MAKPLPRKFLVVERADGRYALMCEIENRSYTAEVPPEVGQTFLEKVYDEFMAMIVQHGVAKPRITRLK